MDSAVVEQATFAVPVEITLSGIEPGMQPTSEQAEEIIRNALEYVSANGTQIDEVAIDGFSVGISYLREPLTRKHVRAFLDGPMRRIDGVVRLTMEEVQYDGDAFLDLLDERLIGGHGLGNITYKLVGATSEGDALLHVTGTEVDNDWLNEEADEE